MNRKFRTIAWVLILVLALTAVPMLTSCGGDTPDDQPDDPQGGKPSDENPENPGESVPTVEDFDPEATYSAVDFSALPIGDYVTLGRYRNMTVRLERSALAVTDAQVEQAVEAQLRAKHPGARITDRAVLWGDTIVLSYVGRIDGVAFSGGSAENQTMTLDEETETGFIPGFTRGMVGLTPGVEAQVPATFPETYHVSALRGKEAVFTVTVSYIVGHPELTDDFASELTDGECTTADAYREKLRGELEKETYENALRTAFWTRIAENAAVKAYPTDAVMRQYAQYYAMYSGYASLYGLEYDAFLTALGTSKEQLFANCLSRVKEQLVLRAVCAEQGLSCDEATYETLLSDYVAENYETARAQQAALGYELTEEEFRQTVDANYRMDMIQSYLEGVAYEKLRGGVTIQIAGEEAS